MRASNHRTSPPALQQGVATLPISLILLILLTLITVYAARVGVLETRTSANKQRAEQAFTASELVLEQGISFVSFNFERVNSSATNGWMNAGSSVKWATCPAGDAELPCSSASDRTAWLAIKNIPALTLTDCVDKDSDDNAGNGVDNIPNGLCDSDPTKVSKAFGEQRYVHLMTRCRDANNDKICDDATPRPANYPYITVVTGGESADNSGKAQVMQTVFFYDMGSGVAGAPAPLTAAGSIAGGGNFNIVVNPDIKIDSPGSIGSNKLSVWAKKDVVVGSSSATCFEGEAGINGFLMNATGMGIPHYTKTNYVPDPNKQVVVIDDFYANHQDLYLCRNCACPNNTKDGAISLNGTTVEDDILDSESASGVPHVGKWKDTTFPLDLFKLFTNYPESEWRTYKALLASRGRVVSSCAALNHNSQGEYWVEGNCTVTGGSDDIGGPNSVVRVIVEGNVDIRANVYIWGVMFVFSPTHATLDVNLNGSPTFYGAMLSNTDLNLSNGSYKSRYLPILFTNTDDTTLPHSGFARLSGSWQDY